MVLSLKDRLIFGLDVPFAEAQAQLDLLGGSVEWVKINSVFVSGGHDVIKAIDEKNAKIFLDLKWLDIPDTVGSYTTQALLAMKGIGMFSIHASGGTKMMKKAVDMAKEAAEKGQKEKPLVIAVTVLTSMKKEDLNEVGVPGSVEDQVLRLAELALKAGCDGVVSSALEAPMLKKEFGKNFLAVSPGIRFLDEAKDDQQRVATPRLAIAGGSDILVMARSLLKGGVAAVQNAYVQIQAGLDDRDAISQPS